ncbi:regulator of cell morphogenesis and NO signaling [Paenibacillus forsythiae]|uniref:Regulator of cell morphogenesis and NO signaling n=1 Tax=Paenibacillus forsythiae TaxID=365616 RepID=A0ABU3H9D0_9BACL|nr:iron-sulfur cluster repair di-iron protein [Paenibacillus forsythiae]MDT3427434.1 regulator of cell morphogenesis and NO signaling [Paenibacillus forsythiae]
MSIKQPLFNSETLVRDIVLQFPKAADYFKANKIDFCCGGTKPLRDAADELGLDAGAVTTDLYKLVEQYPVLEEDTAWIGASSEALIGHIVSKHHRYLREELPLIGQNVAKVFHAHGGDSPHLAELYRLFNELKDELLEHTAKEEAQDFPGILAYEQQGDNESLAALRKAISDLEEEHDAAGNLLRQLRAVTADFTPPEHACTTYRLTYARLEELEGMTFEHVHLENNILFPRYQ